jgi:hypothetical protein
VLRRNLCQWFGHRVNRRKVWHDGVDFRSRCLRCDQEMLRDTARWRLFEPSDESPHRIERSTKDG